MHLTTCAFLLFLLAHTLALGRASRSGNTDEKINQDDKLRNADALQDKGALPEAQAIYNSVVQALNNGHPSTQLGHALNGLSNISSSEGNYQDAIDFARRSDAIYEALGDIQGRAYALNSEGIAEGELGHYSKAQETFRKALAFSQTKDDRLTTVRTLNNLGNVYYFPGQYLEALRSYEGAWDILEKTPGEKWTDYWRAITQINEATLYQRLGRYETALEIYKRLEASSHTLSASDRAHMLTNLGALYRRLGDPWKALETYSASAKLYKNQHDADGELSVLKNIGIVYALDQADLKSAERVFRQSLSRAAATKNHREEMQAHLYLGETLLRKKELKAARGEFTLALNQAKGLATTEEQWKALYGIAQIEQSSGGIEQAEADYRQAIVVIETTRAQLQLSALRAEFLGDKRDVYDALIALLLKKNDVADTFSVLERSRARNFQDRLSSEHEQRSQFTPLTLNEARGYLPASTALLEFWTSKNQIGLIWCKPDSCGSAQKQLSEEQVNNVVHFLRRVPENLGDNWRQQIGILSEIFPAGVPDWGDIRTILIVPDGWLSTVPFELTPTRDGALFIDHFDISYLPTAALLRRGKAGAHSLHWPWQRQLIAFGAPTLQPGHDHDSGFENGEDQALPYAAEEIRSISRIAHGRVQMFIAEADRKSNFLAGNASSAPLLHVASHAFADADNPEASRIEFAPADAKGSPDYLFLRELYDLDLRGINLATLSACDTERGKMIRGEGVQAFGRALLFAGSKSALTTLWRVDDQATKEFMKQFYHFAIEEHQPKARALRSAKIRFLHSGTALADPAHWAAFVLNGDGTDAVPRFLSWADLAVIPFALLVISALAALGVSRHRRRVHRVNRSERSITQ
ncbi:MAG TPA: CHAT domain-containing tetratricopeptide repeat protein [Terriglobales bacterium]|nr:CHAT domain-containing tetratricopeptide repeat protein [Terriglobales bacterium]